MRFLPAIVIFGGTAVAYVMSDENLAKYIPSPGWVSYEDYGPGAEHATVEHIVSAAPEQIVAVPGPEMPAFGEILRFDLTPQAITSRWTRVSTGLTDIRYQGYRVPLVTGTSEGDLAGSLTYYFDSQPRLRRIAFLGTTDNPDRIVQFVTGQFGFRRFNDGNARVTTYRARYRYTGMLQIAPAEVLDHQLAATNYRVELSLER